TCHCFLLTRPRESLTTSLLAFIIHFGLRRGHRAARWRSTRPAMTSRFPGSSEHVPAATAVAVDGAAQPAPAPDRLAALAHEDEPLPEVYARDDMQLLVQSPYR